MSAEATPGLALVTGAARGLGRHLAARLGAAGYGVLVNYLSSEGEAEALVDEIRAAGGNAWAVRGDVGRRTDVEAMFAAADATGRPLALVINNVGIYRPVPLEQIRLEDWERTLRVNLNGAFHVSRLALNRLGPGGQIINIGVAGCQRNQAETFATDYYVSKAALLQLTRSIARVWAPKQIRCNMVSPGQLENSIGEVGGHHPEVPIGRDGTFEDIWQAIDYLLAAEHVTGAHIEVAGGYRL